MRLVDIIKGAISVKKYGLSKSWYYKSCHIDTNAIKKVAISIKRRLNWQLVLLKLSLCLNRH